MYAAPFQVLKSLSQGLLAVSKPQGCYTRGPSTVSMIPALSLVDRLSGSHSGRDHVQTVPRGEPRTVDLLPRMIGLPLSL